MLFRMTKQKCSFFFFLRLVLKWFFIRHIFLFLSLSLLLLLRDYDSGNQILELPELKWFSALWRLFFSFLFIIIFRFHLIIQTFYQPPSPSSACTHYKHIQRVLEWKREKNLTMCLMIYIDNAWCRLFSTHTHIHLCIDKKIVMLRRVKEKLI